VATFEDAGAFTAVKAARRVKEAVEETEVRKVEGGSPLRSRGVGIRHIAPDVGLVDIGRSYSVRLLRKDSHVLCPQEVGRDNRRGVVRRAKLQSRRRSRCRRSSASAIVRDGYGPSIGTWRGRP